MEKDLFEWDELQEACAECLSFSDVKFLRDFGPWKKDDTADNITIDFENSTLKEYDEEGEVQRECKFTLMPVV